MSKNKSQIYLKAEKQWVSVSEEFHKAYFREIDMFEKTDQTRFLQVSRFEMVAMRYGLRLI